SKMIKNGAACTASFRLRYNAPRTNRRGQRAHAGQRSRVRNKLPLMLRFDEPVVAVAAAIEDVDFVGFRVGEDEEIVAQQFHLQNGFVQRHWLERKPLDPDD